MIRLISSILFIFLLFSCNSEKKTSEKLDEKEGENVDTLFAKEIPFNANKWKQKTEGRFPYRLPMCKKVLYNDSIRSLTKPQIINALGVPEKENENHLYYEISKSKVGAFTLTAKFLVIKINAKDSVEWIKVHG